MLEPSFHNPCPNITSVKGAGRDRANGTQDRWGENPTSQGLRRGPSQGVTRHRTGPRQSVAAAGLGAGKRIPLRWLDRAGFELCVRVASPRIGSFSGLSKPGGVARPRSGSKPARNSLSGLPHPRRAEFFAPPVQGFIRRHAFRPPTSPAPYQSPPATRHQTQLRPLRVAWPRQ